MLTIGVHGGEGGAAEYQEEHLARDEYYVASPGRWHSNRAARLLDLPDLVTADHFRAIAKGQAPDGGRLVQGGTKHREGWDLSFSSPKSVSVLWSQAAPGQQAAIAEAHRRAVTASLRLTESLALSSRVGKGGTGRLPAEMLTAVFAHESSRDEDPQLHAHAFLFNTALRSDGKWGTIDSQSVYKWQTALGTAYRSQLAEELRLLGYGIEADGQAFRVTGVSDRVCAEFSRRRAAITRTAIEHGVSTPSGMELVALSTRAAKLGTDPGLLHREWRRRGEAIGFGMMQARQLLGSPVLDVQPIDLREVLADLTRNKAVFRVQELWRAIAEKVQVAGGGIQRIEQSVAELLHGDELVAVLDERYTTRTMLALEDQAMKAARLLAGRTGYQCARDAGQRSLSGEQAAALVHVLADSGLAVLEGRAGTGKSYMLGGAKECWEAGGYQVLGAALSGKAAQGLQEGSGIQSQTLHSLIAEIESGRRQLDSRTVLVVDEAAMVGTNQMNQLLQAAVAASAKVVLVGDSRQLQSIEAGGMFRRLSRELGAAEMVEIRRQRQESDREIVLDLMEGRAAEALGKLDSAGAVHVLRGQAAVVSTMVGDWLRAARADRPGECLMLAATRADVSTLNLEARRQCREAGLLGATELVVGKSAFAEGDRIMFLKNDRRLGVQNGTLGTVSAIGDGALTVTLDTGATVTVDVALYPHITHGYAMTAHKAQGVTANSAFVYASDRMASREWGYVAGSRHRDQLHLYCDSSTYADLAQALSRSDGKEMAIDAMERAGASVDAGVTHARALETEAANVSVSGVFIEVESKEDTASDTEWQAPGL